MVPANFSNERLPPEQPVRLVGGLAERLRHYFDQHPEVRRDEFVREALRREISFREHHEAGYGRRPGCRDNPGHGRWSTVRRPPTAEAIRLHAWLSDRLAALHYERHGLWPKLRRFLFGNRLAAWLGLR